MPQIRVTSRGIRSGYEFLRELTKRLDEPAALGHEQWLGMKTDELMDESHPFKGAAPEGSPYYGKRIRVKNLSSEEAEALGVEYNPEDGRDVYHPWYGPYEKLAAEDVRVAGQNAAWAWSVLNALTFYFGMEVSIAQVKIDLEALVDPKVDSHFALLRVISFTGHAVWGGAALVYGLRYPESPDMVPYQELPGNIAALDEYGSLPVVKWVLRQIEEELAKE